MSSNHHDQQALSSKEFQAFLDGLSLQTLRVRRLKVDAEREFAHSDMKNVQHRQHYAYEVAEDDLLRIDAQHEVRLVGARRKKLGEVAITFSWYYHSKQPVTDKVFQVFAPMVRFQTWPHLREVIQNVAARANWPRLTLPLLVVQKTDDAEKSGRKTNVD